MNQAIEPVLKGLIDQHGLGLLEESGRLKSFLHDECPQSKREISVLMMALEERVPQDLMRVQSGEPLQSLGPRLAKRLADQKSLAREASDWAVRTWARGLGVAHGDAANDSAADAELFVSANDSSLDSDQTAVPADDAALAARPAAMVQPQAARAMASSLGGNRNLLFAVGAGLVLLAGLWYAFFYKSFEVSGVQMRESFVADGKKRDVILAFKSSQSPAQSVQVRFVRGAGNWNPSSWTVNVPPEANAQGQVNVGSLSHRSLQPASMTFEYVLVAANGERTPPFEKTFEIAAATVLPPAITKIDVPGNVYAGRPFSFTIGYEAGNSDVVQIERKVVESSGKWQQEELSQAAVGTIGKKNGIVPYRFQAITPSKNTVEFALVDAKGGRSEPQRVSFEVLPAPAQAAAGAERSGVIVSVREVQVPRDPSFAGAVIGGVLGGVLGNQVGGGSGRKVATVAGVAGGAVAGHQIEKNMSQTAYEITVRFDDGGTQVIRETSSQGRRNGQRVKVASGAIVGG